MNVIRKYKGPLIVVGISILITLVIVSPYIIKNLPLEYGGDLKPTYFPYYQEFRLLISNFLKTGELPFYSWNMFLGNNFWASKSFYLLGDIYNYISLLFDSHFYSLFMLQTFIKISVASLSMYALLRVFKYKIKTSIILGLCYGFSSWIIFYLGQVMFVSFYSFAPLYFLGIELYLRNSKKSIFLLVVTLLLFTNYYLFFALSVLSPFYFLARYFSLNGNFKGVIVSAIKLIGVYISGALITMVMILPSFFYIMQNDRVGTFEFKMLFDNFQIYLHQLQAMFVPSQNIIYYSHNIFETNSHETRELCLWAGTISAILVPQILRDKDKAYRIGMLSLYAVLLAFIVIPSGGMITNGFSNPNFRWLYIFIIINLVVAGKYLNNRELIQKRLLLMSVIVISSICILNSPLAIIVLGKTSEISNYYSLIMLGFISAISCWVLYWIIIKAKNPMILIAVFTVIELTMYNFQVVGIARRNDNSTWEFIDKATHVLQDNPNELNGYLNELDNVNYSSFYRVFIPHDSLYWSYSHNHNLHYQLKGVMGYDSTFAPSFNKMKWIAPDVKDFDAGWIFNIKNPTIIDMLAVKYAVVLSEDELPHDEFTLLRDDYRGSLLVYENNNYKSVGVTYNRVMSYDYFVNEDYNIERLGDYIICNIEDENDIIGLLGSTGNVLENISYHGNYFYGDVTVNEPSFMLLAIPYDSGWNIKVNGVDTVYYDVNGGFIGLPLTEGYNEITMNFIPEGFKMGFILTIIGVISSLLIVYFDCFKNKRFIERRNNEN